MCDPLLGHILWFEVPQAPVGCLTSSALFCLVQKSKSRSPSGRCVWARIHAFVFNSNFEFDCYLTCALCTQHRVYEGTAAVFEERSSCEPSHLICFPGASRCCLYYSEEQYNELISPHAFHLFLPWRHGCTLYLYLSVSPLEGTGHSKPWRPRAVDGIRHGARAASLVVSRGSQARDRVVSAISMLLEGKRNFAAFLFTAVLLTLPHDRVLLLLSARCCSCWAAIEPDSFIITHSSLPAGNIHFLIVNLDVSPFVQTMQPERWQYSSS